MEERGRIYVVALLVVVCAASARTIEYSIDTTWNGGALDHTPTKVFLEASPDKKHLILNVSAPFFDKEPSPPGPPGQPLYFLWEYEVVEVYFLNDENQYLQVVLSPWGQHLAILLSGSRKKIRSSLPLEFTTQREGAVWTGSAAIPVDYLPYKVTKFNAYAQHGSRPNRVYESLYPQPSTAENPDFHSLENFRPIDLSSLLPTQATDPISQLWKNALQGTIEYSIDTTWNGGAHDHTPIKVFLEASPDKKHLLLNVSAPFFDSKPSPPGPPGQPLYHLWEYEVVEAYFLNDEDQYLQVILSPWGQHLVILISGYHKKIRHSLPLEFTTQREGAVWTGSAAIPVSYLPEKVTKFNAFAQRGSSPNRVYESLYPQPSTAEKPDFHTLENFRPIDLRSLLPTHAKDPMSQLWKDALQGAHQYSIDTTLYGGALDHKPIKVSLEASPDKEHLLLKVSGPFFNDPPSSPERPGEPDPYLWRYEVVEAFFLNDEDQYLQVMLSPWGQHLVNLFNGSRNYLRKSLPLDVTTHREGAEWTGEAVIPVDYLPYNVTKFNAFAQYGSGDNRVYESLYPQPSTTEKPDFHRLEYFRPIDLSSLLPTQATDPMSQLWKDSLQGVFRYDIATTWNGGALDHTPIEVFLEASSDKKHLILNVSAPFFDSKPSPPGLPGQPLYRLWRYEVVEAYFVNDENQYLQVILSPWGQHLVILLSGKLQSIRHSLPLEYTAQREGAVWTGSAAIPVEYLPKKVTKFNAFAQHGSSPNRVYESLYPQPSTAENPDFHSLEYFRRIDLPNLLPTQAKDPMSQLWKDALQGAHQYSIDTTWNGGALDHKPIKVSLEASPNKEHLLLKVSGPFFNDHPSPPGPPGEPFTTLYLFEEVEAFFLNDEDQYLQVILSPWGQHLVILFNGTGEHIRHSLPMQVTTQREGESWTGEAAIPIDYLPYNVTKFNAFAQHGSGDKRVYLSLYPQPSTAVKPNFHSLENFRPIDLSNLLPTQATDPMSQLWKDALQGVFRYDITTTWNGGALDHTPITVLFEASPDKKYLIFNVSAPFFNDPPSPPTPPGQPFYGLWNFEVVSVFFLNDEGHYIQVDICPWGQHIVVLLSGKRNKLRHSLPMEFTSQREGAVWTGSAAIPVDYLPYKVNKFNAFAQHGSGTNRVYESLYPQPSTAKEPDFHSLENFKAFDLSSLRLTQHKDPLPMSQLWKDALLEAHQYSIDTTWNGGALDHKPIKVSLEASPDKEHLLLKVSGPFFNDPSPPGPPGEPFRYLYKYEDVEAYFLNDENQYLQVILSPWGQHLVVLFRGHGKHDHVRHSLPLEVTTQREGGSWTGEAAIPVDYLPYNVTKFNAFAQHGSGDKRVYESLYPQPSTAVRPDFHSLETFRPIDLSNLLPTQATDPMSQLWKDALQGLFRYEITTTWNGGALDHTPIKMFVEVSPDKKHLVFNVSAPFFNDKPSPSAPPGQPFYKLWNFEVVEVYFLNDEDQYLQVILSPWGQHLVILLSGYHNKVRHSLPLEFTAKREGAVWTGSAIIPVDYLPYKVTKFNAFAQHGPRPSRVYESLYPQPSTAEKPDFHTLENFRPTGLSSLLLTEKKDPLPMSQVWKDALFGTHQYSIDTTWNGGALNHEPIKVFLEASPDKEHLLLKVSGPFFNDPPSPPGPPGQPFPYLWKFEVVSAFFLNDENQYLQVDICPWGQHIAILLNGKHEHIRHSLPMKVTTERKDGQWTGEATIPVDYLPYKVTKFNAHAVHGSGVSRVYESLYPQPSTATRPDFHSLEDLRPIDLSNLLPTQATDPMSQLWKDALQGLFRYEITTTWDGRPLSSPPVEITLQGFEAGVEMNVTAPFYNDPAPLGTAGEPFYGLWDYEVVEMFFLNKDDEYLEVELCPWGQHLLLLLKGERNAIKHSLPLDFIVTERTDPVEGTPGQWKGSAMIPPGYFPPNVTLMNAYAIHGVNEARQYQALYPAPTGDPNYPQPDFHRLDLFRAIDFNYQLQANGNYSDVWLDAMGSGTSTPSAPMDEVMTTILGPLRPVQTITPEPADPVTSEFMDPVTQQPTDLDTTNPVNPDTPEPTDPNILELQRNVPEVTTLLETPDTEGPQPIEILSRDSTKTNDAKAAEAVPQDATTLPPTTPAPTTLPEPQETSTPTQSPGNTRKALRRRPHPQRVNQNQDSVNLGSPIPSVRPRRRPVPTPHKVRPNRRVPARQPPQQGFPFDVPLPADHPAIQQFLLQALQGQAPLSAQAQHQQFSPRDQGFPVPVGLQFQPPRDQQFQPPRDQQFQPPRDQQFQPPRDQQFQPPRDQQFQPPRDQQFQPPRNQQFQPPRDQQFQPPRDQQFQAPRDQQPQSPANQQFQSPAEERFQPPHNEQLKPPRDQQLQIPVDQQISPPRDQQLQPASDQPTESTDQQLSAAQQEQPQRPSSVGEQQFPPSREGGSPLGLGEEEIGLDEVEEVLTSLTEGSPALPPPHPLCFTPGLIPDEHRCWVFHECELQDGQWQVYSWKCIRGHVFDPFNVACVPGRCRRRRG